jgi:monovalent cation/proton antiporter MnhG/PhaG subunit
VSATGLLGALLLWSGIGVMVAMAIGVLVAGRVLSRLHAASAVATPGGLLVCLGLAVRADTWHDVAKLLIIAVLLVMSSAVGASVTGRAAVKTEAAAGERSQQ